jgi:predicted transposase/invertase (TIGR01784 family)
MVKQTKKPPKVNNPHNARLKELYANKDAFFSLLKDGIKPKWVDSLDKNSLRRSNTSFILQDFSEKEADIVYEATINNGSQKVVLYLLLELQSRVDYLMPYRLLLYIVEIMRHYFNNANVKARKRKNFKFPAIIPIVFFSGSNKWTVPTNLREMFDGHKDFGDSLLDFSYALVDAKGYNDENVKGFQSRLLKIMMMFENSKNVAELIEVIKRYEKDIKQLDDEELRVIVSAISILGSIYGDTEAKKLSEALNTAKKERQVSGMLSNLVANERKREKQLIKQGVELEKIETARALLEMGLSVEQVAKGTRLSVEDVIRIKNE